MDIRYQSSCWNYLSENHIYFLISHQVKKESWIKSLMFKWSLASGWKLWTRSIVSCFSQPSLLPAGSISGHWWTAFGIYTLSSNYKDLKIPEIHETAIREMVGLLEVWGERRASSGQSNCVKNSSEKMFRCKRDCLPSHDHLPGFQCYPLTWIYNSLDFVSDERKVLTITNLLIEN